MSNMFFKLPVTSNRAKAVLDDMHIQMLDGTSPVNYYLALWSFNEGSLLASNDSSKKLTPSALSQYSFVENGLRFNTIKDGALETGLTAGNNPYTAALVFTRPEELVGAACLFGDFEQPNASDGTTKVGTTIFLSSTGNLVLSRGQKGNTTLFSNLVIPSLAKVYASFCVNPSTKTVYILASVNGTLYSQNVTYTTDDVSPAQIGLGCATVNTQSLNVVAHEFLVVQKAQGQEQLNTLYLNAKDRMAIMGIGI